MILIAGEGFSGTTMLLYFLSELLDKPYKSEEFLKTDRTDFPEIIKHNGISFSLERRILENKWKVERLYWITLGIEAAVDKRLEMERRGSVRTTNLWKLTGARRETWEKLSRREKRYILIRKLRAGENHTRTVCENLKIPFIYVDYYKFCTDVKYAHMTLNLKVKFSRFKEYWESKIDSTKVRKYAENRNSNPDGGRR